MKYLVRVMYTKGDEVKTAGGSLQAEIFEAAGWVRSQPVADIAEMLSAPDKPIKEGRGNVKK